MSVSQNIHDEAAKQAHHDRSDPWTYSRVVSHARAGVGLLHSFASYYRPSPLEDAARVVITSSNH